METKVKVGWGALRVLGLIYTPMGAVFLALGVAFWYFLPDIFPLGLVFSLLGGIFLLLGLVFLIAEHRKKKRMEALIAAGRFVWAEVVDCLCSYNVSFHNGRHPWQIVACYELGGQKHLFRSQSLLLPAPRTLIGKQVKVYTDQTLRHYYVDAQPLLGHYVEH
ncbi:MAG: hypothetical protein Q4F17_07905 [Eubacteriales bacterium]|nr:hypothetical protein [Eubacteriales bacterium]